MGSIVKKHALLVTRAVNWLRRDYGCGIVLSEQYCATGEVPDVIGWKGMCRSVVIECKVSRSDFLADRLKPFRQEPENALGCERFYLTPPAMMAQQELPQFWGLLECHRNEIRIVSRPPRKDLRSAAGLRKEMNLLLASLRRVELRIGPQTITEFLKWKNRMIAYNGGVLPRGITPQPLEENRHLHRVG